MKTRDRSGHSSTKRGADPRGVALLAVMIIVALAALIGTAVLSTVSTQAAQARGTLARMQSRAIAWSGVLAVMQELADQRDDLLAARDPRTERVWTLHREEDGSRAIARIIAWTQGEGDAAGDESSSETLLRPEAAKLDLNTATALMLAKLPGVDEATAQKIVALRPADGYESVEELALVGIDAEVLAGSGTGPGLTEYLTTFSADPNVQAGVGHNGDAWRGKPRVCAWDLISKDAAIAAEATKILGERLSKRPENITESVSLPAKEGIESFWFMFQKDNPENLSAELDTLTWTPEPFITGLTDVLRASRPVVEALMAAGDRALVNGDFVQRLLLARDSLPLDERLPYQVLSKSQPTWDEIHAVLWRSTTRCLQWRVRIEGGVTAPEDEASDLTAALLHRVIYEAVIDVAGPTPRIASLRDVTWLGVAREVAAHASQLTSISEEDVLAPSVVAAGPSGAGSTPPADSAATSNPATVPPSPPVQGANDAAGSTGARSGTEPASRADRRRGRWIAGTAASSQEGSR